jgi:ribosomal protein S18 acetylase RimI-like enzyme
MPTPALSNHQITVEAEPNPAEMGAVVKALGAYNASQANGETPHYLFVTLRDDEGNIVGGALGGTYLGWLQIQTLWVSDELRGQGYGNQLMQAAEDEAMRRGCPRVFLETLSFQALPFYEKRGYVVFSRLADFPPGGARYALTKQLGGASV